MAAAEAGVVCPPPLLPASLLGLQSQLLELEGHSSLGFSLPQFPPLLYILSSLLTLRYTDVWNSQHPSVLGGGSFVVL